MNLNTDEPHELNPESDVDGSRRVGASGSFPLHDRGAGGDLRTPISSLPKRAAVFEMTEWLIMGLAAGVPAGLVILILQQGATAALVSAGVIIAEFVLIGAYLISEDAENTR